MVPFVPTTNGPSWADQNETATWAPRHSDSDAPICALNFEPSRRPDHRGGEQLFCVWLSAREVFVRPSRAHTYLTAAVSSECGRSAPGRTKYGAEISDA